MFISIVSFNIFPCSSYKRYIYSRRNEIYVWWIAGSNILNQKPFRVCLRCFCPCIWFYLICDWFFSIFRMVFFANLRVHFPHLFCSCLCSCRLTLHNSNSHTNNNTSTNKSRSNNNDSDKIKRRSKSYRITSTVYNKIRGWLKRVNTQP